MSDCLTPLLVNKCCLQCGEQVLCAARSGQAEKQDESPGDSVLANLPLCSLQCLQTWKLSSVYRTADEVQLLLLPATSRQRIELERLHILGRGGRRLVDERAAAMAADQSELVERAQGGEIDAKLFKAATHETAAPAFRKAVGEEALQTFEGAAARHLQARFGGIIERSDGKLRRYDLA